LSIEPLVDASVTIEIEMNRKRDAVVEERPADAGEGASTPLHTFNLNNQ
jgi:hypothetical protein